MRSPLEAIEGSWRHAVLTTYSISLPFFDRSVLPLLEQAGVANIVVLADENQLGENIESLQASRAGLAYHVAPVHLGPGAFHSKLILLSTSDAARLIVSSANLTVSGQFRNLEVATVLDTQSAGHTGPIQAAATFLNRATAGLPPHVASAVMTATGPILEFPSPEGSSAVQFVHNLDEPLIGSIPHGDITAATPFIDGDGRTARALGNDRNVRVWLDGEHLAVPTQALTGINYKAMRFPRPLHGKAYWTNGAVLAGSPNLSEAALSRTASTGNTEAALVVATDTFEGPPHVPWNGDLAASAQARHDVQRREPRTTRAKGFDAWADADGLHADLPDGALVEQPSGTDGWTDLGTVNAGIVDSGDSTPPRFLRARIRKQFRYAIVHRPLLLAAKRASGRASREREVIEGHLQIDDQSRRVLDGVLEEVIAITELFTEDQYLHALQAHRTTEPQTLTDWRPAHPGDEPRIPTIYARAWSKIGAKADTLLALVRTALRIEDITLEVDAGVLQDLEAELAEVTDEPEHTSEQEPRPPQTTADVLRRYRSTTRKMLERGIDAIKQCPPGDLRDLTFQVLIQQIERLAITIEVRDKASADVTVDRLIPDEDLNRIRLEYLSAYSSQLQEPDPTCANTFRYHLAYGLGLGPDHWTPRQWERLENLALSGPTEGVDAASPDLGMSEILVAALLEPYTSRSDWGRLEAELADDFDAVRVAGDGVPIIVGRADFDPFSSSPVWYALGQAAFLGLSDSEPYVVAVRNSDDDAVWGAQVLIVAPEDDRLYEILINRNTGYERKRYFQPVTRGTLERVGSLGPLALETDSYHKTIEHLPAHLQVVFDAAVTQMSELDAEPSAISNQ